MNTTRKVSGLLLLLTGLFVPTGSSWAQALAVRDDQGVKYLTGGVGQDERDYLKSMQHQFNLRLMFAAAGGAFLSSVKVLIQDSRGGTVLDAVADGPYFYASLPPGAYTVSVSVDQQSQRRQVRVGAGRYTQADFYWK